MFKAVTEILYFTVEPKKASLWFSRFFGQPLCCIEGPPHQCRLRVGDHEIRFQEWGGPSPPYGDRLVNFWSVESLLSALGQAREMDAVVHRGPVEREGSDPFAVIESPYGLLGVVGPLLPAPAWTLPEHGVRADRTRGGRSRRKVVLTGAVRGEVDYTARTMTVAGRGEVVLRVDGVRTLEGRARPGEVTPLPFELPHTRGPVYGSVVVRLERDWAGLLTIAELRVRLGEDVLVYEEKDGQVAREGGTLPIPAEAPTPDADHLPRPSAER